MASTKNSASGTELRVFTFTHSEDAVVPDGWDIVSVDHDRQMAVTRVVASRSYDADRSAKERSDAAGPPATPTYPQPAGAVPEGESPPSTSFAWGSIDTTKVQNLEDLKHLPPPIAEQEAAAKPAELKDETEVATEEQSAANEESADPAHTPDKPVDPVEAPNKEASSDSSNSAPKDASK